MEKSESPDFSRTRSSSLAKSGPGNDHEVHDLPPLANDKATFDTDVLSPASHPATIANISALSPTDFILKATLIWESTLDLCLGPPKPPQSSSTSMPPSTGRTMVDSPPLTPRTSTTAGDSNINLVTASKHSRLPKRYAVTLERIVRNDTCPPVTLRHFMEWAINIEKDPENLCFYLWFNEYKIRFANSPESVRAQVSDWTEEDQKVATAKLSTKLNNFHGVSQLHLVQSFPWEAPDKQGNALVKSTSVAAPGDTESIDTTQAQKDNVPMFREEIDRIIRDYIKEDGARALNLPYKERQVALEALRTTVHPSALRNVVANIRWQLEKQSLPNFLNWAKDNGTPERLRFAKGLGLFFIASGIVALVLLCLSGLSNSWRFMSWLLITPGIATLLGAYMGMCILLHGLGRYQLHPWELFEDVEQPRKNPLKDLHGTFFDTNQPWVQQRKSTSWIRKVFRREAKIEEWGIRRFQWERMSLAITAALIMTVVSTIAIIAAVPRAGMI